MICSKRRQHLKALGVYQKSPFPTDPPNHPHWERVETPRQEYCFNSGQRVRTSTTAGWSWYCVLEFQCLGFLKFHFFSPKEASSFFGFGRNLKVFFWHKNKRRKIHFRAVTWKIWPRRGWNAPSSYIRLFLLSFTLHKKVFDSFQTSVFFGKQKFPIMILDLPSRELTYPLKKGTFESMIFRLSRFGGIWTRSLEGNLFMDMIFVKQLLWTQFSHLDIRTQSDLHSCRHGLDKFRWLRNGFASGSLREFEHVTSWWRRKIGYFFLKK